MIKNNEINHAVELLRCGKIVAFPTETVYGLGADAGNVTALKRVFTVKKRPLHNPLIVHIASEACVDDWAENISPAARLLMQAFWPGPLTLLLPKKPHVSSLVTANQPQIGLRVPQHPIALALLEAFGSGIAAPSANLYTHVSPTTAQAVYEELGEDVDLILEGGSCVVGLESTILDMSSDQPVLLRPGMLSVAAIEAVIAEKVVLKNERNVRAPGSCLLHYAPRTPVKIVTSSQGLPIAIMGGKVVLLSHREDTDWGDTVDVITMPAEPERYAHDLYNVLRTVDKKGYQQIYIEAVPAHDAWLAIADRLHKASNQQEQAS